MEVVRGIECRADWRLPPTLRTAFSSPFPFTDASFLYFGRAYRYVLKSRIVMGVQCLIDRKTNFQPCVFEDFPENWQWILNLSKHDFKEDALIVAGDSMLIPRPTKDFWA